MNKLRLHHIYAYIILLIFGGVVLHAPMTVWFGGLLPDYDLVIKSWKELLMVIVGVIAIAEVTRARKWSQFLNDKLIQLSLAFVAVHLLSAVLIPTGLFPTVAGLMIDLRFVAYFVLVYVLLKLYPQYRSSFGLVGIVGACIVLGFAVMQHILPRDILTAVGYGPDTIMPYLTVDQNPDFVRINSTMRGPNPLGIYAALSLGLIATYLWSLKQKPTRKKFLLPLLGAIAAVMALYSSYSRSAWIAAAVAVGLPFVVLKARTLGRRAWVVISCVVVIIAVVVSTNVALFSNLFLHEDPSEGNDINSNQGHVESLLDGSSRMAVQPFGAGVGSTGSASLLGDDPVVIENQYLFIAHEAGWIGLAIYLALYGLVLVGLWRGRSDWLALSMFSSGLGIAVASLFLPVFVDDTVSIIWWGLAALVLIQEGSHVRSKTEQKAKRIA